MYAERYNSPVQGCIDGAAALLSVEIMQASVFNQPPTEGIYSVLVGFALANYNARVAVCRNLPQGPVGPLL